MEKMKSTFSMWGERGLIATFFADLNQLAEPETINNFWQNVEFPERPMISSLSPVAIHYIIEPDFANTGFGSPDAVIALEYLDSRAGINRFALFPQTKLFKKINLPIKQKSNSARKLKG